MSLVLEMGTTELLGMSSSKNASASDSDTFHFSFISILFPFTVPFSSASPFFFGLAFGAPPCPLPDTTGKSILFPTTATQNASSSSSLTGALSLNSFHHFLSEVKEAGDETSYIRITASCESRSSLVRLCKLGAELTAPRKKAVERLENLSWPAVSYTNHIHKCN